MSDQGSLLSRLDELEREGLAALEAIEQLEQVRGFESEWLDKGGKLPGLMKGMGAVPHEERGAVGKRGSQVKASLQTALEERRTALQAAQWRAELEGHGFDASLPGPHLDLGRVHPVRESEQRAREYLEASGFVEAFAVEGAADRMARSERSFRVAWASLASQPAPKLVLQIRIAEPDWDWPELRSLLEALLRYLRPEHELELRLQPDLSSEQPRVHLVGFCTRSSVSITLASIVDCGPARDEAQAVRPWNLVVDLAAVATATASSTYDRKQLSTEGGR